MAFIELDDGRIINQEAILEFDPRLRRIKYIDGIQTNLGPEDAEKLLNTLRKRQPKKRTATKE